MEIELFNSLLKNPEKLSDFPLEILEASSREFPFASIFHILTAKGFQLQQHPFASDSLKKAAIYSADRNKLFDFIIQKQLRKNIKEVLDHLEDFQEQKLKTQSDLAPKTEVTEAAKNIENSSEFKSETIETNLVDNQKEEDIAVQEALKKQLEQEMLSNIYSLEQAASEKILEDSTDRKKSFGNWLLKLKNQEEENIPKKSENKKAEITQKANLSTKKSNLDLIDSFIKKDYKASNPKPLIKAESSSSNLTTSTLSEMIEDKELITETLANIYTKQGNIKKAIEAYEYLQSKFPEKSSLFAARILELKENT